MDDGIANSTLSVDHKLSEGRETQSSHNVNFRIKVEGFVNVVQELV